MRTAKLGERLLSWVLDAFVISIVMYFIIQLLAFMFLGDVDIGGKFGDREVNLFYEFMMVVVVWIVVFVYQYVSHASKKKATLGQMLVGLRMLEGEGKSNLPLRNLMNFWLWLFTVGFWINKRTGQTYYDDVFRVKVMKIEKG